MGRTDFYFICRLKPLNNTIVKEEAEIEHAEWMNIDKYIESPHVYPFNKEVAKLMMAEKRQDFKVVPVDNIWKRKINTLFA